MGEDRREELLAEEGALGPFFEAARAQERARMVDARLMAAVLADAEAVAGADGRGASQPSRWLGAGGWAAAMAASLALGFGIGLSGLAPLPDGVAAPGEAAFEAVEGFGHDGAALFDLALEEG